jgi:thymidylate synthase (FAD)
MENKKYEWEVSPHFLSDYSASRKSNCTDKKIAGFIPEKKFAIGNEGISVKLISMTDLDSFATPLAYMVNATKGGAPSEEDIEKISSEIYKGGLQHALENIICIFEIAGCSRAFTHQVVRHRQWGFHQQSFRWSYLNKDTLGIRISPNVANKPELLEKVKQHWELTKALYDELAEADIPYQDCRDILPIGTQTYIIAECNLKEFAKTFEYRGCSMFQPQMVYIMWQMRQRILEKYPKLEPFIQLTCEKTKKCMYQGWEKGDEQCNLPHISKRVFESEVYTDKITFPLVKKPLEKLIDEEQK